MWNRVFKALVFVSLCCTGCGSDETAAERASEDAGTPRAPEGRVRGRVTSVDGMPLSDVTVRSGDAVAKTDKDGRFMLEVREKGEVRVAVESEKYSSGAIPVRIDGKADPNVEMSVRTTKGAMVEDASKGGRIETEDGLAIELPAKALEDDAGNEAKGRVEVRYTVVNKSEDITAAPGKMESEDKSALEGYGMAEVRFYQDGRPLKLREPALFEIPMHDAHGLEDGNKVDAFALGNGDKRWQKGSPAMVKNGKVVVKSDKAEWVGAAKALPIDSCVSGRLQTEKSAAKNTTIRAARNRGLSLVQAETSDDGSFCLPVTPNDDWRVSTYYEEEGKARGLQVEVNSSDATGMCGGDGCKSVGDVTLPTLER